MNYLKYPYIRNQLSRYASKCASLAGSIACVISSKTVFFILAPSIHWIVLGTSVLKKYLSNERNNNICEFTNKNHYYKSKPAHIIAVNSLNLAYDNHYMVVLLLVYKSRCTKTSGKCLYRFFEFANKVVSRLDPGSEHHEPETKSYLPLVVRKALPAQRQKLSVDIVSDALQWKAKLVAAQTVPSTAVPYYFFQILKYSFSGLCTTNWQNLYLFIKKILDGLIYIVHCWGQSKCMVICTAQFFLILGLVSAIFMLIVKIVFFG